MRSIGKRETFPRETQIHSHLTHSHRIIHKVIQKETQYLQDLDTIENTFILPLRAAQPPIISPPQALEDFIDDVFGNILELRECNRRLLEVMFVRQREQAYVIQRIGDVFLTAATEFRYPYPLYIGNHPLGERRLKEELENNPELRSFLEVNSHSISRTASLIGWTEMCKGNDKAGSHPDGPEASAEPTDGASAEVSRTA